jgi:hypothetical protein
MVKFRADADKRIMVITQELVNELRTPRGGFTSAVRTTVFEMFQTRVLSHLVGKTVDPADWERLKAGSRVYRVVPHAPRPVKKESTYATPKQQDFLIAYCGFSPEAAARVRQRYAKALVLQRVQEWKDQKSGKATAPDAGVVPVDDWLQQRGR